MSDKLMIGLGSLMSGVFFFTASCLIFVAMHVPYSRLYNVVEALVLIALGIDVLCKVISIWKRGKRK